MIRKDGQRQLKDFTVQSFQKDIRQITDGVWHVAGVGHSNAIFVRGDSGVILIDTLDSLERGRLLAGIIEQEAGKKVSTIIYTHGHPDHRGGAEAFVESGPEIIAFAPGTMPLEGTEMLQSVQNLRGSRQFGYTLTDEENISQGIGIREGIVYGEKRGFAAPTTVYQEDRVAREIDGIRLEMVRLPGETEDQIMVWIPDKGVLCCGDNYYGCWPNLYAIRGGQYRDIAAWIKSLDTLMGYPARYLLPGHTGPVAGEERIQEVLGNFRDAIRYILTETLKGMNQGRSADELAAEVQLPRQYRELPYLGEFYGCVDWTVRAIYSAYLGWFDGNPSHLHPLAPGKHACKTIALMGGSRKVLDAACEALETGEYQWCLELCDLVVQCREGKGDTNADKSGDKIREACLIKADALELLADTETSANGRHYYITCAHELRERHKN